MAIIRVVGEGERDEQVDFIVACNVIAMCGWLGGGGRFGLTPCNSTTPASAGSYVLRILIGQKLQISLPWHLSRNDAASFVPLRPNGLWWANIFLLKEKLSMHNFTIDNDWWIMNFNDNSGDTEVELFRM